MAKVILEKVNWDNLFSQLKSIAPECFNQEGDILNLIEGKWQKEGNLRPFNSSVDGTLLGHYPMLQKEDALQAVEYGKEDFNKWSKISLERRKEKVSSVVKEIEKHKELIALLLVWEIGKPYKQSLTGVERCIDGVYWYIENIDNMMDSRTPLGLISNIASWNYPLSVLVHACLVQVLCGSAVIAKTPTDGGLFALTLCFAIARRHDLPVSLLSGSGAVLSDALVAHPSIDCLSYVGGKSNGKRIANAVFNHKKRYMLEMEGINTYGVWNFTDWANLGKQIKSGFKYGKQRCTAYARFVVQRKLFPKFLDMYLPILKSLSYGNPVLVEEGSSVLPDYDFGPIINAKKVSDVNVMFNDALGKGAVALYQGILDSDLFLNKQDTSAYFAPSSVLNLPKNAMLYHNEPFAPLDSIVLVDSPEELVTEMNVSNGALVSSIACDNEIQARDLASQLRAYKVGINKMKSRGDKHQTFGGIGESWKGCFVGGEYLVKSVTNGPGRLHGNFDDYTLMPEQRD